MRKHSETIASLLRDLRSRDNQRRHLAAVRLRNISQEIVDVAIEQAQDPRNENHRGTLVWLLQVFNCSECFTPVFEMALHGNAEVQCMALMLLGAQRFTVIDRDLRKARKELRELTPRENLPASDLRWLKAQLRPILADISRQRVVRPRPQSKAIAFEEP